MRQPGGGGPRPRQADRLGTATGAQGTAARSSTATRRFVGQGVVAETLNLVAARGYDTGGTVHLVVNNQIGFTTAARATRGRRAYCTDVAQDARRPDLPRQRRRPRGLRPGHAAGRRASASSSSSDVVIDMVLLPHATATTRATSRASRSRSCTSRSSSTAGAVLYAAGDGASGTVSAPRKRRRFATTPGAFPERLPSGQREKPLVAALGRRGPTARASAAGRTRASPSPPPPSRPSGPRRWWLDAVQGAAGLHPTAADARKFWTGAVGHGQG